MGANLGCDGRLRSGTTACTAGCGHERPERLTGEISVERNFFFGVFSSVFSILVSQVGAAVSSSLRICPADGWIRLIDARFRSLLSFVVRLSSSPSGAFF